MKFKSILFAFCFFFLLSCKNETQQKTETILPAKVTLQKVGDKQQIMVNGKPFYIKGAGLEFGNISALAAHGANAFRTWRVDNGQKTGKQILDEAHQNGLMVMMGIEVGRERHGFNYDDSEAVKAQLERIRKEVIELKDHPALLIWGIGNELNLHYSNPKVWDAVNEISKMIHQEDPNHLTTTTLAGISQKEVSLIKEKCPDLDLLSVQMYGDLPNLPKLIKEFGWEKAYIVTEWGATGHWEVPLTSWNAPIEENTTIKANNYLKRYNQGIAADSLQCAGSFVFLWGNKQERTPTWYGIFLEDGSETESVDVMHYVWNGKYPENRSPQVIGFTLNGKTAYDNITIAPNVICKALFEATDPDGDTLTYRYELLYESTDLREGGDAETRPDAVSMNNMTVKGNELQFTAPEAGKYRLFVYAYDGKGNAATANIPFLVK